LVRDISVNEIAANEVVGTTVILTKMDKKKEMEINHLTGWTGYKCIQN